MADHGYEGGRLDLPFVGHCTFGKRPPVTDWTAIDADVAVLGIPIDTGTQYRSGARFGPRGIREASTLFSFGHGGAYDHEDDVTYLPMDKVRIVDAGDVDVVHTDHMKSLQNTEQAVRQLIRSGAMPVMLGGDHSVSTPNIAAFKEHGPIHVIQFDAHLDFVDERHGVRFGHGNPMRRASEMDHVTGLTQLGIRNVSSTAREGYIDARDRGSSILSVRQIRAMGKEAVLAQIPEGKDYYITIDIDGFDPSIAPGTGTPSHGGFLYYDVMELLQGISKRGRIVGVDVVEVAPAYDPAGVTSILAAQVLLNLLGYVFHERQAG
jgi:agmatinase